MRISTRVETQGAHDHVTVWIDGENAGRLVVGAGAGPSLARLLDNQHDAQSGRAAVRRALLEQVAHGGSGIEAAQILLAQPDLTDTDRAATLGRLQENAAHGTSRPVDAARLYLAHTACVGVEREADEGWATRGLLSPLERFRHLVEVQHLCQSAGWPYPDGLVEARSIIEADLRAAWGLEDSTASKNAAGPSGEPGGDA